MGKCMSVGDFAGICVSNVALGKQAKAKATPKPDTIYNVERKRYFQQPLERRILRQPARICEAALFVRQAR